MRNIMNRFMASYRSTVGDLSERANDTGQLLS